jgi:hypothetical protein
MRGKFPGGNWGKTTPARQWLTWRLGLPCRISRPTKRAFLNPWFRRWRVKKPGILSHGWLVTFGHLSVSVYSELCQIRLVNQIG